MLQNGYFQLLERKNHLQSPLFAGIKAAREHLSVINFRIAQIEKDPNVFEYSFIFKKPGFTKAMVNVLVAQASRGSVVSEIEVQKYADWVISQMAACR